MTAIDNTVIMEAALPPAAPITHAPIPMLNFAIVVPGRWGQRLVDAVCAPDCWSLCALDPVALRWGK